MIGKLQTSLTSSPYWLKKSSVFPPISMRSCMLFVNSTSAQKLTPISALEKEGEKRGAGN